MGFLAPWFLGGLAALGVPVFVHLLRRHVTTPRPVSSLMFFERGTQSSTRHRRLRYLLLFALRAALLLLLALAFANPFVRRSPAHTGSQLHLIVLDNSFSMRAGTRFAEAKREALRVLAAKPRGDKAQIVALGGQLEMLTQVIDDDAQLRTALESIQPGDGHASFGELGRTVRALGETNPGPIELHLFSDMQRTAMPGNFADVVLPPNAVLTLHSVALGRAPANWTIESVEAPPELSDPKDLRHSRVRAVVAGFNTPAAMKTVTLSVNGKAMATRKANVPENGRATVDFAPLDVGYGFNRCAVTVDGEDTLPADDTSVFTVRRSDPERVLFVHAAGESHSATYFGAALAAASQGSFILQSMPAEQSTDLDPSRFAFVVLSDALALPTIFEHALAQYVARGGSVLIALGAGATRHTEIPLWGAGVQDVHRYSGLGGAAGSSVGRVDFSYPPLAQARPGRENGGWAGVKVFHSAVVDPAQARVAAWLTDGTPLLLEKQLGEGRVMLFASGFDNLTNDLAIHPVFVAFVDRTARYLSGREQRSGFQLVDSFIQLRASGAGASANVASNTSGSSDSGVDVLDPDGHRALSLSEARTAQSFRFSRAGFYQVRFANGRDGVIGVNPDRRESDLEPLPKEVLDLWTGAASASQPGNASSGASSNEKKDHPVSLWWYVMLLALAAAIAETAVASGYMGTLREQP